MNKFIITLLSLISLTCVSPLVIAADSTAATVATSKTLEQTNLEKIQTLTSDIVNLNKMVTSTTGDEQNKNKTIVAEQLKQDQLAFKQASDNEQLILLTQLNDNTQLLLNLLKDEKQNNDWATSLNITASNQNKDLELQITQLLKDTAASLEYDAQQEAETSKQLKSASEAEKATLAHKNLVFSRKKSADTQSLQTLVTLADQLQINTAEYKQQLFEATGNITKDILNVDVAFSLLEKWKDQAIGWFTNNALQSIFNILVFILLILLGKFLSRITRHLVSKAVSADKLNLSRLMQEFFISLASKIVFFIVLLIALSQIGLNLGPLLAGFGVAGVIIGFALQDTLSNFAAGMMLLIYRPFDVGDFINAGGVAGKVHSLNLVSTTIHTPDNQIIIVPNSSIWGGTIINVTREKMRRVDLTFGIGYGDDILKAEKVLADVVNAHDKVLKSPAPVIKLHTLNDSSVDFVVRPWCKTADYWDVYWDITRAVKLRFDEENISIPFPQSDVHLHMVKENEK